MFDGVSRPAGFTAQLAILDGAAKPDYQIAAPPQQLERLGRRHRGDATPPTPGPVHRPADRQRLPHRHHRRLQPVRHARRHRQRPHRPAVAPGRQGGGAHPRHRLDQRHLRRQHHLRGSGRHALRRLRPERGRPAAYVAEPADWSSPWARPPRPPCRQPPPVDIDQYSGTWYEQGSVPQFFSIGLVNTTAIYTPTARRHHQGGELRQLLRAQRPAVEHHRIGRVPVNSPTPTPGSTSASSSASPTATSRATTGSSTTGRWTTASTAGPSSATRACSAATSSPASRSSTEAEYDALVARAQQLGVRGPIFADQAVPGDRAGAALPGPAQIPATRHAYEQTRHRGFYPQQKPRYRLTERRKRVTLLTSMCVRGSQLASQRQPARHAPVEDGAVLRYGWTLRWLPPAYPQPRTLTPWSWSELDFPAQRTFHVSCASADPDR